MSPAKPKYVGLLSCSGEEYPGGTVSRIATRRVLQDMLQAITTTICVPLFLAGDEQERDFVKKFPCVTIDGCEKACAKRALDEMGIEPVETIILNDYFTEEEYKEISEGSVHDLKWKDHPYCQRLAETLADMAVKIVNPDQD